MSRGVQKPHSTQDAFASLRQVLVQYARAMNELGWTCVNVTPGRTLDSIEEQLEAVQRERDWWIGEARSWGSEAPASNPASEPDAAPNEVAASPASPRGGEGAA